jgi:hypothetical protein
MVGDLSGFQEIFPLNGFSEEFDYSRDLRYPGQFGTAPARQDRAHCLVWRCSSLQGADVAVIGRPLVPKNDIDRLFAVCRHRGATVVIPGEVYDPEPDLRVHLLTYC